MKDVDAGQVSGPAIDVDLMYEEGPKGPYEPIVRDVEVVNLKVKKSRAALSIRGYEKVPVRNVHLRNCTFEQTAQPNAIENVEDLKLENVTINGKKA